MWKTDLRLELNEQERQELERLGRSQVAPHRAVVRARTIRLLAALGDVISLPRQLRFPFRIRVPVPSC